MTHLGCLFPLSDTGRVSGTCPRPHQAKRSGAWAKFKCGYQEDILIGGYTRGRGGRSEFGALIVGCYKQGQPRYVSKVGTGFSHGSFASYWRRAS